MTRTSGDGKTTAREGRRPCGGAQSAPKKASNRQILYICNITKRQEDADEGGAEGQRMNIP